MKGIKAHGVRFVITNREALDSARLGMEVAAALQQLYPNKIDLHLNKRLIGSEEVMRALQAGEDPRTIQQKQVEALEPFLRVRGKYLLY